LVAPGVTTVVERFDTHDKTDHLEVSVKLKPQSLAAVLALAFTGATLTCVPVADAGGGTTIAAAPQLSYGQLEGGGGTPDEFWRIAAFTGDKLTLPIDWGQSTLGVIDIYGPGVDDYTLSGARAVDGWQSDGQEGGKRQYSFLVPFTGTGTLAICQRNGGGCNQNPPSGINSDTVSEPFTFTVADTHAVSLTLRAPSLARRGSLVTVTGQLRSPAGTPQGSCLFPGEVAAAVSSAGTCSGRVRLGQRHRQTIRVQFVPNDGWQATSARRAVRLIK
jgi:hypothetical protein